MAHRQEISEEQYISAAELMAAVRAHVFWQDALQSKRIKVARTNVGWLDRQSALAYLDMGDTKFRALIKKHVFPEGVKIDGKLMWRKDELDECMVKLMQQQRQEAEAKRSNAQTGSAINRLRIPPHNSEKAARACRKPIRIQTAAGLRVENRLVRERIRSQQLPAHEKKCVIS
jgi:hypothetical protein